MPQAYSIIPEMPVDSHEDADPLLVINENKKLMLKARFWECRHYVISNRVRLTQALRRVALASKFELLNNKNNLFESSFKFDAQLEKRSLFAEYQAFIIKKSLAASVLPEIEDLYESFHEYSSSFVSFSLFLKAYDNIKNYLTSDSSAIIDRTF